MTTSPPRWLENLALAAFLVTIPSSVWRLLMLFGALRGTEELRADIVGGGWPMVGYVVALSVVEVALGFAALGLVQPWGERLAARLRLSRGAVTTVAVLGGVGATALFTIQMPLQLASGHRPDGGLVEWSWATVAMAVCYAPTLLWGPLVIATAAGYAWRHRGAPGRLVPNVTDSAHGTGPGTRPPRAAWTR